MRTTIRNSYTPKTGEYCNTIVVDQDKGVQYIFDSDGIYSTYTSKQQEGAPMGYVDAKALAAIETAENFAVAKDAEVLQAAKDYTDQHGGGGGGVTQQYVDEHDATTLQDAKNYADGVGQSVSGNIPTKTSELQNDSGFITSSSVPTVNNATLTIQKNGTNVATFTANSSTNSIADISVPVFTLTNTDPGEGGPLAENNFIGVYQ